MKFKIKTPTEGRLAKLQEVFGIEGPEVEYSVTDTQIILPNGIVADYVKTVKNIKGYEILKNITIEVKVGDKEFTLRWQ